MWPVWSSSVGVRARTLSLSLWLLGAHLVAAHAAVPRASGGARHPSAGGLKVMVVSNLFNSYADHGTGAKKDLSTWTPSCSATTSHPKCTSGPWSTLGDLGQEGYSEPSHGGLVAMAGTDARALARPIGMTLNWDTHKTVLVDGSASAAASETSGIFTPACPAGYGAMGAVAVKNGRAPVSASTFPTLMCVHQAYLVPNTQPLTQIWAAPTSFTNDGSVWLRGVVDPHQCKTPGTNCAGCTFKAMCQAADTPGCCVWEGSDPGGHCVSASARANSTSSIVPRLPFVAGSSTSFGSPSGVWALNMSMVQVVPTPVQGFAENTYTPPPEASVDPTDQVCIVPSHECLNSICYQGTNASITLVEKIDPLACKVAKGKATVHSGNCSSYNFSHFVSFDPIFKTVGLWRRKL